MATVRRTLVAFIATIATLVAVTSVAIAQSRIEVDAFDRPATPPVRTTTNSAEPGYWLVADDGGIVSGGAAGFYGSTGALTLNQPIVGMTATPTGNGYWLVAADGGIFAFGDAEFHGSTGAIALNQPIVGIAATPTGNGYWLVAADGGIFAFGDAEFHGSTGAIALNQPIVGMAPTPSGTGYWFTAADGGVFSFGDAVFYGSTGAIALNQPISGVATTPTGDGYWLVAADGGIFGFGDAAFHGSTGAFALNQPIVGMAPTPSGAGYWFTAADGGVFSFGDARFLGSGAVLGHPVVAIAASAPTNATGAATATKLAFTTEPGASATGGAIFARQPIVTVQDASGAKVETDTSAVRLRITGAGRQTLTCRANPVAGIAGAATFAGCRIDRAGTYTLTATDGGLTSAVSTAVVVTVGAPARVGFVRTPGGAASLVAFATQPLVAVQDLGGNTVISASTGTVALSITRPSNPAVAVLMCDSTSVAVVNGVATFAGCRIDLSGTYTLHAAASVGGLVGTSTPLAVSVGAASKLGFITQPDSSTGGTAFTTQPSVAIQDAGGNTVVGDLSPVTLTISRPSAPVAAALACTSPNPSTPVNGVAAFAGCAIDRASATTYTLQATVTTGPAAATSAPLAITVGAPAKLGFLAPIVDSTGGIAFGTQPRVDIEDAGGNRVTTSASAVTLTISQPSNPTAAALTCTANPKSAAAGVANFAGCRIDLASTSTYTLHASVTTGPPSPTSTPFSIAVGAIAQLVFSKEPSGTTASNTPFAQQPQVSVEDAGGNVVTTDNTSSVTLDLTRPSTPGGAIVLCSTNTTIVTAGVGTFTGCRVDLAGNYSLTADVVAAALTVESTGISIT